MPQVAETTTARVEGEARDTDNKAAAEAGHTSVAEPETGVGNKSQEGEKTTPNNTLGSGTQHASTPTMAPQDEATAAATDPATERSADPEAAPTQQTQTTAEAKADPPPNTAQQDKQHEPEAKPAAEQPHTTQQDKQQKSESEPEKAAAPAKDSAARDVKSQVLFTEKDNFYQILGVSPECTSAEQLKKAYKSRSLLCHPDKHHGSDEATAQFQLLQKAYDTLKDPALKAKYDQQVLDRLPKVSTPRRTKAPAWDDLPEEVKSAAVSKTQRDKLKGAAKLQAEKAARELTKSAAKQKARDKAKADREAKKAEKAASAKKSASPKLKRTAKAKTKTSPKKRPAPTSTSPKQGATSTESKKGNDDKKEKKEPPVPRQQIQIQMFSFQLVVGSGSRNARFPFKQLTCVTLGKSKFQFQFNPASNCNFEI